jgi:hypothetical protein
MSDEPGVTPIPMILYCPMCHFKHVDEGNFATKPHHTHACQGPKCGLVWRPAIVPTVGVEYLPNFKNVPEPDEEDACSPDKERGQEAIRRLQAHLITRDGQLAGVTRATRFLRAELSYALHGWQKAKDAQARWEARWEDLVAEVGPMEAGVPDRTNDLHEPSAVAEFLDGHGDRAHAAVGESLHDAADVVRALHSRLQRIRDFVRGVSADDSAHAVQLLRRLWSKAEECKTTTYAPYDVEEWMELERAMRTLMLRAPASTTLVVRAREESNTFLHRLWSKAVGTTSYDKEEWKALERCIFELIKGAFTMAYAAEPRTSAARSR